MIYIDFFLKEELILNNVSAILFILNHENIYIFKNTLIL